MDRHRSDAHRVGRTRSCISAAPDKALGAVLASAGSGPLWSLLFGAVAQLAEHFHGMEGVVGSIPIGSTEAVSDPAPAGSVPFLGSQAGVPVSAQSTVGASE